MLKIGTIYDREFVIPRMFVNKEFVNLILECANEQYFQVIFFFFWCEPQFGTVLVKNVFQATNL